MPLIPFPNVPPYPGVPLLVRAVGITIPPVIQIALGTIQGILASAFQYPSRWGIYDSSGNQLGVNVQNNGAVGVLSESAVLSTYTFDFEKEMRVSDYALEAGSFASFNKVELPANPVVALALDGSEDDRSAFLNAVDVACKSTGLYSVVTPEVTYANYSIDRYTYSRKATKGATLLIVEISLKEIRQVSAGFTTSTPINQPQNAGATPPVDSGLVQPQTPDTSTLKAIMNKLGIN